MASELIAARPQIPCRNQGPRRAQALQDGQSRVSMGHRDRLPCCGRCPQEPSIRPSHPVRTPSPAEDAFARGAERTLSAAGASSRERRATSAQNDRARARAGIQAWSAWRAPGVAASLTALVVPAAARRLIAASSVVHEDELEHGQRPRSRRQRLQQGFHDALPPGRCASSFTRVGAMEGQWLCAPFTRVGVWSSAGDQASRRPWLRHW